MRVTTAFKRLLRLDGVDVTDVAFGSALIVVTVVLRRRRLVCGHCGFKTRHRYDTRPVESRWHLDLGVCGSSCGPRCAGCAAPPTASWWKASPSPARGPS